MNKDNILNKNDFKLNISGLVSYTLLLNPNNNKLILLLGDIHDGVQYCEKDQMWIDTIFDKIIKKTNIKVLLEEVPRDGLELIDLWPNAEHTKRLKEWFLKNQDNIIPIDIRPYLIPFSHQKYELNLLDNNEKNIIMKDYLRTITNLFELNNNLLDKTIIFFKNIFNALQNKSTHKDILKLFKKLEQKYKNLLNEINQEESFEKTIKSNYNWFSKLEEFKLNIMDWYTILLLLGNNHNIVHFGLAHYLNVFQKLKNNFNFKVIHESGLNNLNEIKDPINACINII